MVERDERGRYASDHTDADVLAAVQARDPAGTSEVADELGIARQSADKRLRQLADDGRVERKKIGAVVVWWLTEDEPTHGGPADPLFDLVGLFGDDEEAAERARERSREFREGFNDRMNSRRERATADEDQE